MIGAATEKLRDPKPVTCNMSAFDLVRQYIVLCDILCHKCAVVTARVRFSLS